MMRRWCENCGGYGRGTVQDPLVPWWKFWRRIDCPACGGDGHAKPPGWPDREKMAELRPKPQAQPSMPSHPLRCCLTTLQRARKVLDDCAFDAAIRSIDELLKQRPTHLCGLPLGIDYGQLEAAREKLRGIQDIVGRSFSFSPSPSEETKP